MKYANVMQHSEEDCGAACLATISQHYGKNIPLYQIREQVGTSVTGSTLLGLKQGAESLGFQTSIGRVTDEALKKLTQLPLPAIIHWKGQHWVVLYGIKSRKYIIFDPAVGIRYISGRELDTEWTSRSLLLLEPDNERFVKSDINKSRTLSHFLYKASKYPGVMLQALFINCIIGVLSLATPFLIQILTDDVLVRGDTNLLTTIVIAVWGLTCISSCLSFIQSNLVAYFGQRLELSFILDFVFQILRLPLHYYEARRSGEVISRLRDVQEVNQLISEIMIGLPSQFFIAIISLGLMIFYSWKLAVASIVGAALMTLSTVIFLPSLKNKTRQLLVKEAETQGVLVETFKGTLTLKTINATSYFWQEFRFDFGRLSSLSLSTIKISILNSNFSNFVSSSVGIGLLWYGGWIMTGSSNGAMSIGQLLAFKTMNDYFVGFISSLVSVTDEYARAKTAIQRLNEVINLESEKSTISKPKVSLFPDANIDIHQLNFYYPGRIQFLKNLTISIPGGHFVALVGPSGCGKSSLAKLIAQLHRPQSGNIRIGRFNQADVDLECWRRQVSLVPQDAHFWSRSILENFQLASPEVSFEDIVQSCIVTGADQFIQKLPNQYQTILGEFGANLSGGQRQRLAISRALLNNPPVLILDESTSALDPSAEAQLLEQLFTQRQGKTTILITHRSSVINKMEWVIYMNDGKIQYQGNSQDLTQFNTREHNCIASA